MNLCRNKQNLSVHKVRDADILLQQLLQWKLIFGIKQQHTKEYLAFLIATIGAKALHISMKTKVVNQYEVLTWHGSLIHLTKKLQNLYNTLRPDCSNPSGT